MAVYIGIERHLNFFEKTDPPPQTLPPVAGPEFKIFFTFIMIGSIKLVGIIVFIGEKKSKDVSK